MMSSLFFTFGWGESNVNVRLSVSTCCLIEEEQNEHRRTPSFDHLHNNETEQILRQQLLGIVGTAHG